MDNSKARIRWHCARALCQEVSLYFDSDPPNHTWWPRAPDSSQGARRRALELHRNDIESTFANVKHHGIGTKDQRCLWAQDAGVQRLTRLHFLWQATRRLVHENADYESFAAEYRRLGMNITAAIPSTEAIAEEHARRPPQHQWTWSAPGRAADW